MGGGGRNSQRLIFKCEQPFIPGVLPVRLEWCLLENQGPCPSRRPGFVLSHGEGAKGKGGENPNVRHSCLHLPPQRSRPRRARAQSVAQQLRHGVCVRARGLGRSPLAAFFAGSSALHLPLGELSASVKRSCRRLGSQSAGPDPEASLHSRVSETT